MVGLTLTAALLICTVFVTGTVFVAATLVTGALVTITFLAGDFLGVGLDMFYSK